MTRLLTVLLLLSLSSCYTQKKAGRQVDKAHRVYGPIVTAGRCAAWYPIVESDSTFIQYIRGEDRWRTDTVEGDCGELIAEAIMNAKRGLNPPPTKTIRIPCPPCNDRVDTFSITRQLIQESTAKLADQQAKSDSTIASINDKLAKAVKYGEDENAGKKTWRSRAYKGWGAAAGLLLALAFMIYLKLKP